MGGFASVRDAQKVILIQTTQGQNLKEELFQEA